MLEEAANGNWRNMTVGRHPLVQIEPYRDERRATQVRDVIDRNPGCRDDLMVGLCPQNAAGDRDSVIIDADVLVFGSRLESF
nr:hypothetical protein [Agromyces sp. ISL-38]